MAAIDWPFDTRNVNFKLRVRAAFNPSIGHASVTVPWLDASGELAQPVNTGPLSSLVAAAPEGDSEGAARPPPPLGRSSPSWTGAVWVEFEEELGFQQVTEKLMRTLQRAVVPVSIQIPDQEEVVDTKSKKKEAEEPAGMKAKGAGRLPLGPLLLGNVEPPADELPPEPAVTEKGKGGKAEKGKKEDPKAKKAAKPEAPPQPPPEEVEAAEKKPEEPPPPQIARRTRPCEVHSSWSETIGIAGLHRLEVTISTDRPVLSPEMLRRFVPICLQVDTVRNLPNERPLQDLSDGVRVEVRPRLGTATAALEAECQRWCSATLPHDTCLRFSEPVVWLLGLSPLHCVREWMMHEELIVEVRDRELSAAPATGTTASQPVDKTAAKGEVKDNAEGEDKATEVRALTHPHGVASFNLAPLLDPHNLQVLLRAEVAPQRGNKRRRNAELSREQLRTQGLLDEEEGSDRLSCVPDRREVAPQYARHATICTMTVSLAVPIPAAPVLQKEQEAVFAESWATAEKQDASATIHRAGDANGIKHSGGKAAEVMPAVTPYRAKVAAEGGDAVTGPWRKTREEAEADEARLQAVAGEEAAAEGCNPALAVSAELHGAGPSEGLDCKYERFGRAVLVFNDKDTHSIKSVLEAIRQHNGGVLGIDPTSYHLDTRELTEEEVADPFLDLVTGFMILDGQFRLAVIEGLRSKGLESVLEAVPGRGSADGSRCKVLHHSGVGFSERLYTEFGPLLKQVKVRTSLEKLASKPELYSISVPCTDEVLETMQAVPALKQLCRLDRLHVTRQGILYPEARHLKQLEILYGDYITDGELEGGPPGPSTRLPKKPQKTRQGRRLTLDRVQVMSPAAALMADAAGAGGFATSSDNVATIRLGPDMSFDDGAGAVTQDLRTALAEASSSSKRPALDQKNKAYEATLKMRAEGTLGTQDFKQTNRQVVLDQSLQNTKTNALIGRRQQRELPFLEGKEVYIYSNQKLNCTELQKEWMRQEMLPQEDEKCWSYAPIYLSQNFELTAEGAESGVRDNKPERYTDTYANKAGDARPPWRAYHARPVEEFRKVGRDLPAERREDLREPFVENEWHRMPLGEERKKPVSVAVRFEPDKLPHVRRIAEKPFDPARAQASNKPFGPQAQFQSVHYHGRAPGESRGEESLKHNLSEREAEAGKIRGETWMRTFSQGQSRSCVTDLDRHEKVLKPVDPIEARKGITRMEQTLRHEPFQEFGRPDLEFQSRMRENHASPPFDVRTGGYVRRDPNYGTKEAGLSGKLGKAPWRHGAAEFSKSMGPNGVYPSATDFNLTKQPPISIPREEHIVKNATRMPITSKDRTKAVYKRPRDTGVAHIVQPVAA
mmetsp:Transcript_3541/g.8824  ORF Transcript_3541/g.8824 Transcript_3541/m.8824 type:complete len:1348 (+) Transcript_3541:107-4150(+)